MGAAAKYGVALEPAHLPCPSHPQGIHHCKERLEVSHVLCYAVMCSQHLVRYISCGMTVVLQL